MNFNGCAEGLVEEKLPGWGIFIFNGFISEMPGT
jgi:hypothetical protein